MNNPYSPPLSNVERSPARNAEEFVRLEKIRTGQRLVVWAMLLYFGIGALSVLGKDNPATAALIGLLTLAMLLPMIVLAFMGLFRMWSGFGTPVAYRIILAILMFVPLIGLLVLASSSSRATKRLRQHGYRVGLLGAGART
jgi:hypothetical protein